MQPWELSQYQIAATEMVRRLGMDPNESVQMPNGGTAPRWMIQANRMHEIRLTLSMLNMYGLNGPI